MGHNRAIKRSLKFVVCSSTQSKHTICQNFRLQKIYGNSEYVFCVAKCACFLKTK